MPNSSLERVFAHRPARAWRPSGRYPTAGRQSSPSDRRVTCFGTARVVTVIPNLGAPQAKPGGLLRLLICGVRESGSSLKIVNADHSDKPSCAAQPFSRSAGMLTSA